MSAQNLSPASISTTTYYNNYQTQLPTVSSDQDAAVTAYFQNFTNGNQAAAQILASAVIYTSLAQGTDPMSIISEFAKLNRDQGTAYLSMFLNLNRIGTSLLGINNRPTTNKYVQRSILL